MDHSNGHPFDRLIPDVILDAVESVGFRVDGRFIALNSYENRVYQVGLDDAEPIVVKFYRPGRWQAQQIQEEHDFSHELAAQELPIVAPLRISIEGKAASLFEYAGFRFSISPRQGGHPPELDNPDHLLILGRLLGRIHRIGALKPFRYRESLELDKPERSRELILSDFIPQDLRAAYDSITRDLIERMNRQFRAVQYDSIRLHGDCHPGNILWRNDNPHLVDLDDAIMGPAIQDIWMLLSGERLDKLAQLIEIADGYNEFYDFPRQQLQLVEALRSYRIINYAAWLASRWDDPAFPMHFPWFNTTRYWSEHILELREQQAAMEEEPLDLL